jgi:hypothetical protein
VFKKFGGKNGGRHKELGFIFPFVPQPKNG